MPNLSKSYNNLPTAKQVFLIIFLGIAGMFGYYEALVSDIKTIDNKTEFWIVRDLSRRVDSPKQKNIDTLRLVYHHRADFHLGPNKPVTPGKIIPYDSVYFSYNTVLLVWIALGAIVMGFGLAILPVIYSATKSIITEFHLWPKQVLVPTVFTVIIGTVLFLTPRSIYFTSTVDMVRDFGIIVNNPYRLTIFIVIGMLIGLLAFWGQLLVNSAIDTMPASLASLKLPLQREWAQRFLFLRNKLRLFLLIDSILIVFSIVMTDAFRRAINVDIQVNLEIFPKNYVYLYGLMFTFYLAIIYIPVYNRLKLKGIELLTNISISEQENELKDVASILKIQQTPFESIQVGLSILAPIITSLVPGIFKI
jgi:hypothetical protein